MLSPGEYLRCSENSTEKPWNGLACNPAKNPSTMNLARRSSRLTWRITSGFRYCSAVAATGNPPRLRSRGGPAACGSEHVGQGDGQARQQRAGVDVADAEEPPAVAPRGEGEDDHSPRGAIDDHIFANAELM